MLLTHAAASCPSATCLSPDCLSPDSPLAAGRGRLTGAWTLHRLSAAAAALRRRCTSRRAGTDTARLAQRAVELRRNLKSLRGRLERRSPGMACRLSQFARLTRAARRFLRLQRRKRPSVRRMARRDAEARLLSVALGLRLGRLAGRLVTGW